MLAAWHRGHQADLAYRVLERVAFLGLQFLQQKSALSGHLEGMRADSFNVLFFPSITKSYLLILYLNTLIWDYLLSYLESIIATLFRIVPKIHICSAFSQR